MSIEYSADGWLQHFSRFAKRRAHPDARAEQCTATGMYALQYNLSWRPSNNVTLANDLTHLQQEVTERFGPLVRVVSCDAKAGRISLGVLPMPSKTASRLRTVIEKSEKLLSDSSPGRITTLFLLFAIANVALGSILLHNHWHAYDEPWNGALDFLSYHYKLYTGSHEQQQH